MALILAPFEFGSTSMTRAISWWPSGLHELRPRARPDLALDQLHLHRPRARVAVRRRVGDRHVERHLAGLVQLPLLLPPALISSCAGPAVTDLLSTARADAALTPLPKAVSSPGLGRLVKGHTALSGARRELADRRGRSPSDGPPLRGPPKGAALDEKHRFAWKAVLGGDHDGIACLIRRRTRQVK